MSRRLSTREAARILQLPEARVRAWARALLEGRGERGRRYGFDFRDLLVLRTAAALVRAGVPPVRMRRALTALQQRLPEGGSLSELRIRADARAVMVQDASGAWNAETGQRALPFDDEANDDVPVGSLFRAFEEPEAETPGWTSPAEAAFDAALALEDHDPDAAIARYEEALELDPGASEAAVNLVRLLHMAGRRPDAIQAARGVLARDAEDPLLHFNLAICLRDEAGAALALPHFERAAELDPSLAEAHWGAGELCEELGRRADALRHYRAFAKLTEDSTPTDPEA